MLPALSHGEWPLVGREAQLALIDAARSHPECPGVVVSAAAGVGKSRLAREVAAQDQQAATWVQATRSAASVPLGAFAGVLPEDVQDDDQFELLRRSAAAVRERAGRRPALVVVDDAQLLDVVSAALVLHLAATRSAFVLVTVRVGEPCPDAIVSLSKDAGAQRVELPQLDGAALTSLVETVLGGVLEQQAASWVLDRSRGNALYARELVLGAVAAGTLESRDGLWQLTATPTLTRTLLGLVSSRLRGLDADVRLALEFLALAEPLRVDELAALTSYEALERAEGLGLVRVNDGDLLQLEHPLYGDALREMLPSLHGRGLRLRLADALARRTPPAALQIIRLRRDASAAVPSELLVEGARAATQAGDAALGEELAQRALDEGSGLPATLALARAQLAGKRYEAAEAALAAAERTVAPDAEGLTYLELRTQALYWGLNRPHDAQELIRRASDWSPEPGWRQALAPLRMGVDHAVDDAVETLAGVAGDSALTPATRRRAEHRLAVTLFFAGRTREAAALAPLPPLPLRGFDDALVLGIHRLIGTESGEDWPRLNNEMADVLRAGVRAHDDEAAGHGALGLASLAFLGGHLGDAARWLAEAELHFTRQDAFGNLIHARALRVGVTYFAGDLPAAQAAHTRLQETLGERIALSSQAPHVARAHAWDARAVGDDVRARDLLFEAAGKFEHMPVYAAALLYEALLAGAPAAIVAERLGVAAARCDARLVAAYLTHARAEDGETLLAAAEQFATLGAARYAAQAAADAAARFASQGDRAAGRRAMARARGLSGDVPIPAVAGLDLPAVELTQRERQLVDLAADGLTNAQIAQRLVLSTRTVESHLYRAMGKLGVDSRADLRRLQR